MQIGDGRVKKMIFLGELKWNDQSLLCRSV